MSNELVFVYNANSGKLNAMLDSMHKIISPATYACNLCRITYGTFTELPEWKQFRESFEGTMTFLHIDEFERDHPPADGYPVIFEREADGTLTTLADASLINGMRDIQELIQFCRDWARLAA
jgi:3'-phosphoadenosine 5'-phosphosulfate sulfotransferase (PAPS reductase)/FAD synthetase